MRIVSIIVALVIIATYFFPGFSVIGTVDCYERSIKQYMTNSFYHANLMHLVVNMIAFYQLSVLEEYYGSVKFAGLLLALLVLSSLIHYIIPDENCSVGFSSVLVGLVIFARFLDNNWVLDASIFELIFLLVVLPSLANRRISFWGHLSGVLAGILLGFGFRVFGVKM